MAVAPKVTLVTMAVSGPCIADDASIGQWRRLNQEVMVKYSSRACS